ncbi:MAG: radical SAM family heme chaperone HemW [Opitutus sp.]|nr:radical SAM family heme chaperone HemW [Opitutus sp.]MCS6246919.1 radical SAM family heme chaperone HemW [Opitutus sp.]MCS6273140.1 radical SAM family heme chaperone HemW [Opitutus sp.]MCS6279045.1 radical SAM family heme chaperone HemW [Opitutus sp.]MCS6298620.1 radical SAM family heme chaperone HemW [Opitutus sp.]
MSEINPLSVAGNQVGPLGLYVHVPFCSSTCDFCAFYQTAPTADGISRYMQGIDAEADLVEWGGRRVETVFWGGGTPGLLSPKDILTLGCIVRSRLNGGAAEWTVEMAPASVTQARLAALKEIGVTRISMGAQSFQPALLDGLGRQHTREQIFRAYERIREADFASVNIDLMFALPGQDEAAWLTDLGEALALAPDHLSTYCLTFEEDTKLWVKLSKGQVKLDVEHEARLYETTWERLEAAGYGQYEVSNFARSGHACLHNLNTWRMHEWVGLGPSAASQHAGVRGGNVADLAKWHAHLALRDRVTEDRVALTPSLLAEDALIFGVRMNAGVNLAELSRRFPSAPWSAVEFQINRLQEAGVAEVNGGHLRLTPRGRIIADAVGAEIMDAFADTATK